MIGVGLACEFFLCLTRACFGSGRNTSVSQSTLPPAASTHIARSDGLVSSPVAVVRYTRPPATTGDDQPRPGTLIFQATFLDVSHSTGTFVAVEMPWPVGPRNWGQSSARAGAAQIRISRKA